MKPAPFAWRAAAGLAEALATVSATARPMAGGQSLGPMMNLRLSRPAALVDVAALAELRAVEETDDAVILGAAITHAEIEDGAVPDPTPGWLAGAAANIAHRAVRNRGTLGGSLAHADPAADWVIVMTGLGATAIVTGPGDEGGGERRVAMEAFVTGPYQTALGPGEILRAVSIPRPGAGARWGYWKFMRQVGEFAKASATVLVDPARGAPRVALGALGRQPHLFDADTAEAITAGRLAPREAVAAALPDRDAAAQILSATALARALEQT